MMDRQEELAAGLAGVRQRIAQACSAAGRPVEGVTLVVVTKFFPASDVTHLAGLGVTDVGENRHQEAAAKMADLEPAVRAAVRAHFIGQLQSNKAAAVARYADVVQSIDRAKVARALSRAAAERETPLAVTLQVDLQGTDAGRGGVRPENLLSLADEVADLDGLDLRGLMAVAPLDEEPERAFERLAGLHGDLRQNHPDATWLSAGMSGDLEQAVAVGATHLRVGSAILGSRPAHR